MQGPIPLSPGDYTIRSFGCDPVLSQWLGRIAKSLLQSRPIRWSLMSYWGRGKSTILYNLAYLGNQEFFFNQRADSGTRCLFLFTPLPTDTSRLLEYVGTNGLPWPWSNHKEQRVIREARLDAWRAALRRLVLFAAENAIRNQAVPESEKGELLSKLGECEANPLQSLGSDFDQVKEPLVAFLSATYESTQEQPMVELLPYLLLPISEIDFLEAQHQLFAYPGRLLRNFDTFRTLCKLGRTCLFIVFDEFEDWKEVQKGGLDRYLIDECYTKSYRDNLLESLSYTIVLRSDLQGKLRRQDAKRAYSVLSGISEKIAVEEPSDDQVLSIAAGLISLTRAQVDADAYFPFTPAFLLSLSKRTRIGGQFNIRAFLKSMNAILERSLQWDRRSPMLESEDSSRVDCLAAIEESLAILAVGSRGYGLEEAATSSFQERRPTSDLLIRVALGSSDSYDTAVELERELVARGALQIGVPVQEGRKECMISIEDLSRNSIQRIVVIAKSWCEENDLRVEVDSHSKEEPIVIIVRGA